VHNTCISPERTTMKAQATTVWRSPLIPILILAAFSGVSYSSAKKKPKAYRDINAIGHRVIGFQNDRENWYSVDFETQTGTRLSAEYEKSTSLIHDVDTQAYIDRIAQMVAHNSDTQFAITTRVVDSERSFAVTLAGGYQYISRGLLLQMENEGEVAAVIARGTAHTSLRSATGLSTRANLMKVMMVPLVFVRQDGAIGNSTSDTDSSVALLSLKYARDDESAADYFGVQYLYKSGYSPECFISFIKKVWPAQAQGPSKAFSVFPPLPERLEALRREIQEILPNQNAAITNNESFARFREHLLTLPSLPEPPPKKPALIRGDSRKSD
jgi:beta-barrel assembly-enhancing protease